MSIKKGLLIILIASQFINAAEEIFSGKVFDQLAITSFNSYLEEMNANKKASALWYMNHFMNKELHNNINDEFTLEDILDTNYKKFTQEIKEYGETLNSRIFEVSRFEEFGAYDFEKQYFPIERDDKELSIEGTDLYSKKDFHWASYHIKLIFDNFDEMKNILPMVESDAKNYLAKRKEIENAKHLQRLLSTKYIFKINNISVEDKKEVPRIPFILTKCEIEKKYKDVSSECNTSLSLLINAKIERVEYFDKADGEKYWDKNKNILLHTVNY